MAQYSSTFFVSDRHLDSILARQNQKSCDFRVLRDSNF